jgi:DUF971 family protein
MSLHPAPKNITADRTMAILTTVWSDGHVSVYPFGLLRAACPCAACRGGHENMSPEPDEAVFSIKWPDGPEARIVSIEQAGAYGIILVWEDGHRFGIYNWHFLRALCPCEECRSGKSLLK